jgi:mRNA-degrading endonuclease RelE of RelBE toxin-antitoxin system
LTRLGKEPPEGDIIPLSGYKDEFRLRIGSYRVLFHFETTDDGTVFIAVDEIDNRGQVYKG